MGGLKPVAGGKLEPSGETGALDLAHLQFNYIAGHLLCAQLSWDQWGPERWDSGPPQAYILFMGDRLACSVRASGGLEMIGEDGVGSGRGWVWSG